MRRSRCRQLGVEDGRPYCIHGPMAKAGIRNDVQEWRCSEKKRQQNNSEEAKFWKLRYRVSEHGKAARRRYHYSEIGQRSYRESTLRYEENHIRIQFAPGVRSSYPLAPEKRQEFQEKLSEFRMKQSEEYSEVNKVWLDQQDSPEK